MLELNKAHEITRKNQVFGTQISHNISHGKKMLGSKNQSITKLWLKRYK